MRMHLLCLSVVSVFSARSELRKVLFLSLSVGGLFVYGEWICTKFTWKTCLVPRSDEVEGQGHQGQKTTFFVPFGGLSVVDV